MTRVYAAGAGAFAALSNGEPRLSLEGMGARSLAVNPDDPDTVYVGTTDEGIFKSESGGERWDRLPGLAQCRVTSLAVSPADGAVYAGTEPSSLFVSRDGGESWRELEGMKNLPSAPTWSFPPRPWTSHVRAIAPGRSDAALILAGIELGGIVRSADGGETWQDQRPGAYADCHSLATHPALPEAMYEAGGGGFAESRDSGESWSAHDEGLDLRYVWGLAADPADPELLYVSAASGPGRAHGGGHSDAAIYHRKSGRWTPLLEHLREFPYALAADPTAPGSLYAGFGDGEVHLMAGDGGNWRKVASVPGGVEALVVVT